MPTAVVTGASSGIRAAFACRLSADGYDVIAVARRRGRLEQLQGEGSASELIVADLADPAGCLRVENRLAAGGIELLVNNAGIGVGKAFEHTTSDEEDRMLALNVRALMRLTHAALPPMLAAGSGQIVNVGRSLRSPVRSASAATRQARPMSLRCRRALQSVMRAAGSRSWHCAPGSFAPRCMARPRPRPRVWPLG